jgi:hypothetical protein
MKLELIPIMAGPHMDFVGQRADKAVVADTSVADDGSFTKEVEYYTMTCPDCDGDGYYDDLGEVICEDCGVVISGDKKPNLRMEYGDDDGTLGGSRGLEVFRERDRGSHQPGI